ncbi:hypothetical protein PoB_005327000 [Plakobranchus ocellatus]|uniref:Uncharacterized protein n=1 Tax=Plakobranchus ocellatus TaxID=259542 RepID=A0AAV4C528_9GAST|nr:hypothetical protein PoB_005327000 [Plakobranchus ocellatus]
MLGSLGLGDPRCTRGMHVCYGLRHSMFCWAIFRLGNKFLCHVSTRRLRYPKVNAMFTAYCPETIAFAPDNNGTHDTV